MNFLKIYGVGIFILVFLTVNSEGSAQYLTGMVFYLAKSVLDGGLPGIIRTMRAGKSVPFTPGVPRVPRADDEISEMARARESDSDNVLSDSESKVRRLIRQLWPDLDCETDNTCKVPADSVLKSDSRENSASTSSSEENFLAEPSYSAEEETMGNDLIGAETNAEEMTGAEEEEDIQENSPFYLTSAERERRRKIRRQNRMRDREPPPPPPPPFHYHNHDMYQDERDDDGMHPDGPPPPGPPPYGHMGPHHGPPPPWITQFHREQQEIRNRKKNNNAIPVAVTQKHTPVSQDFIKYSKVFKPNPSTTTTTAKPTPPVISKRFFRILRQHNPSIPY